MRLGVYFQRILSILKSGGMYMKIREVMTNPVIRINPEESVAVAARTLAH